MTDMRAFGTVPLRAAGDERLSELHLRLLIALSYRDRQSSYIIERIGCTASLGVLATDVGRRGTSKVCTALKELEALGYISAQRMKGKTNVIVRRVTRWAYEVGEVGADFPNGDLISQNGQSLISPDSGEVADVSETFSDKKNMKKNNNKITTSPIGDVAPLSADAQLAMIERRIRSGSIPSEQMQALRRKLEFFHDTLPQGSTALGRAYRLLEEVYADDQGETGFDGYAERRSVSG